MRANNYIQEQRKFRSQAKRQLVSAVLMVNWYQFVPNVICSRKSNVRSMIINLAFDQFITQAFRRVNVRNSDQGIKIMRGFYNVVI